MYLPILFTIVVGQGSATSVVIPKNKKNKNAM